MVKKLYRYLRKSFQKCKWTYDAIIERAILKKNKVVNEVDNGSFVILIPHADDEWIGCSRIIQQRSPVYLVDMDMPGGDSKEMHCVRKEELKQLARKFNTQLYILDDASKKKRLYDIIINLKPDYILLPFFYDWHPEHLKVIDILDDVLRNINIKVSILMYQVSMPISCCFINHALPLSRKEQRTKWRVFQKIYKTQSHIPTYRFSMNELIYGKLINSYAAEVFVKMSAEEWLESKKNFVLSQEDKDYLLSNINKIRGVRKILDSLKK